MNILLRTATLEGGIDDVLDPLELDRDPRDAFYLQPDERVVRCVLL